MQVRSTASKDAEAVNNAGRLQKLLQQSARLLCPEASADLCYVLAKEGNADSHVSTCKEVLRKLDMLLPQAVNQLRRHHTQEILDLACHWTGAPIAQQPSGLRVQPNMHSLEALCLAMQVLGTLCSKAPDQQLLHASGKSILGALESSLKAINSKSALKSTERHIHTGLRALNIILTSAQSKHGLNMIDLVEILRQCFTFGVDLEAVSSTVSPSGLVLSPAGAQPASAVRQTAARYRPPHRRQSSSNSGWSSASEGSISGSEAGSDSDSSKGSSSSSRSQCKASAVRLAAFSCLQTLTKTDSRALHPHWPVLMPVYNPLQTKYHPATLMDAIVRDPVPKVRASAAAALASMLEGPAQKAYLNVAEAKSAARPPVRGFTTLSTTLGHLVIALHDGLLHAISSEAVTVPLVNMLKALQTLMASAAYSRLPTDLLPRCIEAVNRRLQTAGQKVSGATTADTQAVQAAACSCLSAAFGTKAAVETVASMLGQGSSTSTSSTVSQLHCTLLELSMSGGISVRTEALAALTGLARNYPQRLVDSWSVISHAVALSLNSQQSSSPKSTGEAAVTADARYTQQAMKLLTSYLAACTQLAITPAQPAQPGLPTPPNMSSETHMRDSANAQHGAVASHASSDSAAITSSMLEQRPGLGGSHCQRDPSCSACQPAAAVGGTIFSNTLGAEPHSSSAEPSGVVSVAANGDARVIPMEAARCGVHSSVTAQTTENANPHVASQITLAHLDFDMMQCAEMWTEACCHQIPEAMGHMSPHVRSAAHACMSECAYPCRQQQPQHLQHHMWQLVQSACGSDEAAAVRAAAARCLGCLAEGPLTTNMIQELKKTCQVLKQAAQDPVLSVRMAVLSTAANVTDSLAQQCIQSSDDMLPVLTQLAAVVVMGCGDNDKVLVNAVRALGNLFAIRMQEPTHDPASSSPSDNSMDTQTSCSSSTAAAEVLTRASNANQGVHGETSGKAALLEENGAWWGSLCQDQAWFHAGLQCLLASLHSQTEKVQWNACYALGTLFRSPAALSLAAQSDVLQQQIETLLKLIESSPSYKVQTHAAAALSKLQDRSLYAHLWPSALLTVSSALAELQDSAWQDQHDASPVSAKLGSNFQFKDTLRAQLQDYLDVLQAAA